LDRARDFMSQSMLQVFQSNLTISSLHVILAELYLEAGAIDKSRDSLKDILKAFPANGYAKLIFAKLHLAEGNNDASREALAEAMEIWSDANDDYIFLKEAKSLMDKI
ncbi:MAG: hypothetical protein AAF497_29265, partial [Planctomycetota bacterium]